MISKTSLSSNVKFYADDTMLYSVVSNPATSARELNEDLEKIRRWAYQWKLEFNPDPAKQATEIIFSCKRNKPIHPLYISPKSLSQMKANKSTLESYYNQIFPLKNIFTRN